MTPTSSPISLKAFSILSSSDTSHVAMNLAFMLFSSSSFSSFFLDRSCRLVKIRLAPAWCSDFVIRSEEHTSELQSRFDLVCRLLLEKKNMLHKYHMVLYLVVLR